MHCTFSKRTQHMHQQQQQQHQHQQQRRENVVWLVFHLWCSSSVEAIFHAMNLNRLTSSWQIQIFRLLIFIGKTTVWNWDREIGTNENSCCWIVAANFGAKRFRDIFKGHTSFSEKGKKKYLIQSYQHFSTRESPNTLRHLQCIHIPERSDWNFGMV